MTATFLSVSITNFLLVKYSGSVELSIAYVRKSIGVVGRQASV